jgi:CBS domain-containing protein
LLANDCLSSLPPLTFFRDAVVDEAGESSDIFDLETTALRPLVDVGRVFGIAAGRVLGGSTQERFRLARTLLPEREAIFRQASETMRVVLYQQARAGIRQRNSGSELPPSMLSHYDRQILKSGFRAILDLLEFTADGSWLEAA